MDWAQILKLAPGAAAAASGDPQAGAMFMQGLQQGREMRLREQMQQQQTERQGMLDQSTLDTQAAQRSNLEADNTRAAEQAKYQRLQQALGMLSGRADQLGQTATDATAAESQLLGDAGRIESMFSIPQGQLSPAIPPMAPVVSARKKKQAEELYTKAEKLYGPEAMAQDSITLQTGELFGDVKPSQLRAMFGPAAVTQAGAPAAPAATPSQRRPLQRVQTVDARGRPVTKFVSEEEAAGQEFPQYVKPEKTAAPSPTATTPDGAPSPKLTAAQQSDLADMLTVQEMAAATLRKGDALQWRGVGGMYSGSLQQTGARHFNTGTSEEQDLRNFIGNIQATIAKLRGGTSFTPNEQKLLDTYTPTIDDSPKMIKSKLRSLQEFVDIKRRATLTVAGGGIGAVGGGSAAPIAPVPSHQPTGGGKADPLGIR
jgi:hypothetical protein